MACSRNDNLSVFSDYVANLASLFSHFLMPVDDAVCQGNRCQLSTAIASAAAAPATVEHSIVATRERIAISSGLCMR